MEHTHRVVITPLMEVAKDNPGAMKVLTAHPDLTEYCRIHGFFRELIWVVYKDMCGEDAQKMKELVMKKPRAVLLAIRKNSPINGMFCYYGHPYGKPKQQNGTR